MAKRFTRNIRSIKDIEKQPKYTNEQNDLLSDKKDVYVRNQNKYEKITGGVHQVNNKTPDDSGNVEIDTGVMQVNGKDPDEQGNIDVDSGVKTVANVEPDKNGNVNLKTKNIEDINLYVKHSELDEALDEIETGTLDLSGYATEDYVDQAIDGVEIPEAPDLGDYATKNYVDEKVSGIDTVDKSRIYVDDILYYAGTVSVRANNTDLVVNFSDQTDKRLFFRTIEGDYSVTLENLTYTIPHNSSLVLNRNQSVLEVIQTNDFVRGVHWLLVLNHFGIPKMMNIKATEIKQNTEAKPRVPKEIYKRSISQDGCLVGDEVWLLNESDIPHDNYSDITRLKKDTFEEIGTISHNLGHGNSVDYRNGKLLVISGAPNAEICLYDTPIGKETLNFSDSDNTVITFKESDNKTFKFDRTVVFGEDEKILYFVNREGVCKVLLGMGDNDLSDTTSDKSDGTRWGSFVQGKKENQYNGTAKVLEVYKGFVFGATQCSTYDGHLYVMNGFEDLSAYKVRLDDKTKTYEVVDLYTYYDTDYKNNKKHWEPESIFFVDETLYLTGTTETDGIIVGLNK